MAASATTVRVQREITFVLGFQSRCANCVARRLEQAHVENQCEDLMTSQGRRVAGCHLVLRGNRWMPISVNKTLGAKDRCSPVGAVISAYLSAVVEGHTIVGWLKNSAFSVQEVLPNGTLAPLDLAPAKLALQAYDTDMEASKAGIVGVNSLPRGVAFRNKILETFLRSYVKLHSNALRYRYGTKFRVIPLSP